VRTRYSDPSPWHFLSPEPQRIGAFRRSNLVAIVILAFFTLGLLSVGFVTSAENAVASHSAVKKLNSPPAPTHLVR
jgi:hypothetical protein